MAKPDPVDQTCYNCKWNTDLYCLVPLPPLPTVNLIGNVGDPRIVTTGVKLSPDYWCVLWTENVDDGVKHKVYKDEPR